MYRRVRELRGSRLRDRQQGNLISMGRGAGQVRVGFYTIAEFPPSPAEVSGDGRTWEPNSSQPSALYHQAVYGRGRFSTWIKTAREPTRSSITPATGAFRPCRETTVYGPGLLRRRSAARPRPSSWAHPGTWVERSTADGSGEHHGASRLPIRREITSWRAERGRRAERTGLPPGAPQVRKACSWIW